MGRKNSSNLETKFKFNFHRLFFKIFLNGKTSANYQLIKSVYWKILSRVDKVGLYLPVQGNTLYNIECQQHSHNAIFAPQFSEMFSQNLIYAVMDYMYMGW